MRRDANESIDRFFMHNIHLESRTIYIGDGSDGEIDSDVAKMAIKGLHILTNADADTPITLYINSIGGCWFSGMAVYDMIRSCPCEVTAYVLGSAMSMGSIILQAADKRVIYPSATIMVHDGYESSAEVTPQTFENWAEHSKKARAKMYKIYSECSGRPISFWRRKCAADTILSAAEAKTFGLVDSIQGE